MHQSQVVISQVDLEVVVLILIFQVLLVMQEVILLQKETQEVTVIQLEDQEVQLEVVELVVREVLLQDLQQGLVVLVYQVLSQVLV